jgi:hypothetical protein
VPNTLRETRDALASLPARDEITTLFSLNRFCRYAYYPKTFAPTPGWSEAVVLTAAGETAYTMLRSLNGKAHDTFFKHVLFMSFSHQDLFIDGNKTDPDVIAELISAEISKATFILPSRFGRKLYDKFNDRYLGKRIEHLEPEEAAQLLADEPQGVYQAGRLVSGPLGLLKSLERRYVPPTVELPLWHCQDIGCAKLHEVALGYTNQSPRGELERLEDSLQDSLGPPGPWSAVLRDQLDTFEGGKQFYDLVAFLGDCLTPNEIAQLFEAASKSAHRSQLLQPVSSRIGTKRGRGAAPRGSMHQLSTAEMTQLLLQLKDETLIALLDSSVLNGAIRIGRAESRKLRIHPPRGTYRDTGTEISQFGMRSVRGNSTRNLETLVFEAHKTVGLLEKLAWKLRSIQELDVRYAINKYVSEVDPVEVVRELLLSDPDIHTYVENAFIGLALADDDRQNALRIAWRLGFDNPVYDDRFTRLEERLRAFQGVLHTIKGVSSEAARSAVRSVGVNLFVSVEEFLEELIAFNVWFLSSDHHADTHFVYCYEAAMRSVSGVLGEEISDDGISWSNSGRNTLGGLLAYLDVTLKWVQSLPGNNSKEMKPASELPHWHTEKNQIFPFRHKQLWADSNGRELLAYIGKFEALVKTIRQAKLAFVRNGLDHKRGRDEFPSVAEMLACCKHLSEALQSSDVDMIYPKIFWNTAYYRARGGVECWEFSDREGKVFELRGPSLVHRPPDSLTTGAKVIGPGNLLGYPNAEVVFSVVEETEYLRYWSEYPRRAPQP